MTLKRTNKIQRIIQRQAIGRPSRQNACIASGLLPGHVITFKALIVDFKSKIVERRISLECKYKPKGYPADMLYTEFLNGRQTGLFRNETQCCRCNHHA